MTQPTPKPWPASPLGAINKLHILGQAALFSREIREAYIAAQQRALDAVKDDPRDIHRVNKFAELWLTYFAEEYGVQGIDEPEKHHG